MSGSARSGGDASWLRWLPGLRVMRSYQRAWLRHDVVAGLVFTTMLVPVGIAYAAALSSAWLAPSRLALQDTWSGHCSRR